MTEFSQFMEARESASTAFVNGDVAPLLAVSVADDPASIFPPNGTLVTGAAAVNSGNEAGARAFSSALENAFEILHCGADGDLGYWTGTQRSRLTFTGSAEPVRMALRVTELFRRVDGEWKLFHRHADPVSQD